MKLIVYIYYLYKIVCNFLTSFLDNIPYEFTPNFSILPLLPSNKYTVKINNIISAYKDNLSTDIDNVLFLIELIHIQSLENENDIDINPIYELLKKDENIISELVNKYKTKIDKLVILLLSISRENKENMKLCYECLYLIFSSGYYDIITTDICDNPDVFVDTLKMNENNEIQPITPYENV